jgi:hypothetical protein
MQVAENIFGVVVFVAMFAGLCWLAQYAGTRILGLNKKLYERRWFDWLTKR